MVSLLKLAKVTEKGVEFQSPHDGTMMMLTPEKSIDIQNSIGKTKSIQIELPFSILLLKSIMICLGYINCTAITTAIIISKH